MTGNHLLLGSFLAALSCVLTAADAAVPIMERIAGPTAMQAVVGDTRLTAGISATGEVVLLKWPSPSSNDHLLHRTLYPVPWYMFSVEQYDRLLGAHRDHGVFQGLRWSDGGATRISWFRDAEWSTSQRWIDESAPALETVHRRADLGLTVTLRDGVVADGTFVRLISVSNPQRIACELVSVVALAPCIGGDLRASNHDFANDETNGGEILLSEGMVVAANAAGLAQRLAWRAPASSEELDQMLAQTRVEPRTGVQKVVVVAGWDVAPSTTCIAPSSPFDRDPAALLDQPLREPVVGRSAVAAQVLPLQFDRSGKATRCLAIAVGDGGIPALRQRVRANAVDAARRLQALVMRWQASAQSWRLPASSTAEPVLRRTVVNLLLGQDRDSGMVSGGFSSQPAYGYGWPREAGYYNLVLAASGFVDEACRNGLFWARTQRTTLGQDSQLFWEGLPGSWAQCYAGDGRPAWVYDLEIDEVGLGAWAMWTPVRFIPGVEARRQYLRAVMPAIARSADLLTSWKDPWTGLQPLAREDDLPWLSQSVYGSATTLLGLKAALLAADLHGWNPSQVRTWEARAAELHQAIWRHWWQPTGRFETGLGTSAATTLIWPACFAPAGDARIARFARDAKTWLDPFLRRSADAVSAAHEWWYVPRATAAILWARQAGEVEPLLRTVLAELPRSGVWSYGESVVLRGDGAGGLRYDTRVATPQNFTSAFAWLSAAIGRGWNLDTVCPGSGAQRAERAAWLTQMGIGGGP